MISKTRSVPLLLKANGLARLHGTKNPVGQGQEIRLLGRLVRFGPSITEEVLETLGLLPRRFLMRRSMNLRQHRMTNLSTWVIHKWDTINPTCTRPILPLLPNPNQLDKALCLNIPTTNPTRTIHTTPILILLAPRWVNQCSTHNHIHTRNHNNNYPTRHNTCGIPLPHSLLNTRKALLRSRSIHPVLLICPLRQVQAIHHRSYRPLVITLAFRCLTTTHRFPRAHHRHILIRHRMYTASYTTQKAMV